MRQPNYKSKTNRLVLTGRDEERERINAFKELCARNNLKVRDILMEKVDSFLRQHNWPPGNSQTIITAFSEQTKITQECSHPNCQEIATYEAWGENKTHAFLCDFHKERDKKLLKRVSKL